MINNALFIVGIAAIFYKIALVYVPPPTYVGVNERATACSPRLFDHFTADQRNSEKWNTKDEKYCFGDPTNQKELFARSFHHNDDNGHQVAIMCRLVTTKATITAGSVFNVGLIKPLFKELHRDKNSVVWAMNQVHQSHSLTVYASFWGSESETPVVECIGYKHGKVECDYADNTIANVNKTCPA